MKNPKNHQDKIIWAVIISEASHVFCCVLPALFSVLSLMSGIGLISAMPIWLVDLHEVMHAYEIPMIIASAVILAMGWGLYYYSKRVDCHSTGCAHEPCTPRKKTAAKILIIASLLFAVNVSVYFGFHRAGEVAVHAEHDH